MKDLSSIVAKFKVQGTIEGPHVIRASAPNIVASVFIISMD